MVIKKDNIRLHMKRKIIKSSCTSVKGGCYTNKISSLSLWPDSKFLAVSSILLSVISLSIFSSWAKEIKLIFPTLLLSNMIMVCNDAAMYAFFNSACWISGVINPFVKEKEFVVIKAVSTLSELREAVAHGPTVHCCPLRRKPLSRIMFAVLFCSRYRAMLKSFITIVRFFYLTGIWPIQEL